MRTLQPKLRERAAVKVSDPPKVAKSFYLSKAWRELMASLIEKRGRRCEARGCGRDRCRIFGHHIVELEDGGAPLDPLNVRLLCGSCHTTVTGEERAKRFGIRRA